MQLKQLREPITGVVRGFEKNRGIYFFAKIEEKRGVFFIEEYLKAKNTHLVDKMDIYQTICQCD